MLIEIVSWWFILTAALHVRLSLKQAVFLLVESSLWSLCNLHCHWRFYNGYSQCVGALRNLWYIVYTVIRWPFSVFFAPRLWRRLHYADWLKNVSDIAAYPTTSFRLGCLFTLIQWKTQTCIRKHVVGCKKGELNTVAFQIQRFPRFSSCKQQNRFQNTGYGSRRVTCHVTTLAAKWIPILLLYCCSSLASW